MPSSMGYGCGVISERHDWLMVQVEEVAQATRKIAAAMLEVDLDEEQRGDLDVQTDELLEDAFEHSQIARVDARTAALILRPPARIQAYARLLAAKSQLVRALGRERESHSLARRALELLLEAADLEPDPEKIDREAIVALLERDPPAALGERGQALLEAFTGTD
jgi:hypothetical protein